MGKAFVVDGELRRGASAEQRMIEAIRRHYRRFGAAPSFGELEGQTGVSRANIGQVLHQLAKKGLIERRARVARSIALHDRGAMLSDAELELAAAARGARIVWPLPEASFLTEAYEPVTGTDSELPLDDLLAQVDAAVMRNGHDGAQAGQDDTDDAIARTGARAA